MSHSSKKQILSWIVGIFVFGVLNYGSEQIASIYDLPTSFYFQGFEYDQYVEEDKFTSLGWFLIVIQIFVASRIGMSIYYGNFRGGTNQNTNLLSLVFISCVGLYAFVDTAIWQLFESELREYVPPFVYNILNLGVLIGIGYLGLLFFLNKKVEEQDTP